MFSFKKKNQNADEAQSSDVTRSFDLGKMKERLFFHDLINQTHGLLLFLDKKEMRSEGMDHSEIQMIKKEIKTLQSLVRDHYNYKHKNLFHTYDWVAFEQARSAFQSLCETYLPNVNVTLDVQMDTKEQEVSLIHYPTYYRIVTNLIKNIAEAHVTEVRVHFIFNDEGLFLETKNQMLKSREHSENLAHIILEEKTRAVKSLGLDSIHYLAETNGGHFTFEIENNTWVNRLFLPTKKSTETVKKISA